MSSSPRPMVIGLTGGIASGKTAVSDRFAEHDVPIIDADVIAREVVEPGTPGLKALVGLAGESILTPAGRLDRQKLRQKIFSDPTLRSQVEAELHPRIRERMGQLQDAVDFEYCILSIPLLVESGRTDQMDRVLVVDVSVETQRQRLMARDGSTDDQVDKILAAQVSREERLKFADDVIDNSGTLEQLEKSVARLHRDYLKMARRLSSSITG